MEKLKYFGILIDFWEKILKEEKCFWTKEQSISSVLLCLKEENDELLEALEIKSRKEIVSEASDILNLTILFVLLARKEKLFSLEEVVTAAMDKIKRRSPYIFDKNISVSNSKEAQKLWEQEKSKERGAFEV